MPWLLSGGTLSLHHAFDADAFAAQCRDDRCDTVVVPGALVPQLAEAGLLDACRTEERAGGLARAGAAAGQPGLAASERQPDRHAGLRRDRADRLAPRRRRPPVPLPAGDGHGAARLGQRRAGRRDRAHRGRHAGAARADGAAPSVPARRRAAAPRRISRPTPTASSTPAIPAGSTATAGTVTVTGPPPGIVSVGGYRFVLSELEDLVRRADGGAFVTALPDALAGHRLAGISRQRRRRPRGARRARRQSARRRRLSRRRPERPERVDEALMADA